MTLGSYCLINNCDTWLLYSHPYPYGKVSTIVPGPIKGGGIKRIIQGESLRCGISSRNDQSDDKWVGLDIDYCCALSTSVLKGKTDSIEYKEYNSTTNIAKALLNGIIDVYMRERMCTSMGMFVTKCCYSQTILL